MAKKQQNSKPWDVTQQGTASYRDLQAENARQFQGGAKELGLPSFRTTLPSALQYDYEGPEQSPLMQQTTRLGNRDYLGNSVWDPEEVTTDQLQNLSDIRAENQPWYSKLVNGIGKAGVLAATTALETAGLLYGAGHSMLESAGIIEDDGKSWLQDLWDNPITNALQKVTEVSEEYMPNYYTRDEQENPFGNIFTANFLGDKLLKNLGFMVGAFYGGIPASSLIGKAGTSMVKGARAASLAERAGMARRVGELTAQYGDDVAGLERALAREGLTEAERGKRILEGFDKVRNTAKATRATTQTIGALGSAINEGAIEALNNSKDWARQQTQVANDEYQQVLASIEQNYGGTEMETTLKMQAAEDHERKLAEIEKGRASMGNADLLLNIPVLMASNMYQLGKLYSRGFDSTRRQMGSLLNGHSLSGNLAKGTLKTDKTWKGALGTALLKSNTEGMEEYLQRAASDGAGNAVSESIKRFMESGQNDEAETSVNDFIAGFGKAIADNLGDPNAWEEYMIGAVSSMIGMPVFGSQTKNSYIAKDNGVFGFAGGIMGNYQDYMAARDNEAKVAEYLNGRVKDPKFKALYDNLKKQHDYDKWLQEEIEKGDKSAYKDLELEKFYSDLNAAASSGHLEEFKQLVGYNTEYSDEELEDIVKQTSRKITAEQQRKQDEDLKSYLEGQIAEYSESGRALTPEEAKVYDDLNAVNRRLEEDDYQDKLEGPFIDRNGQMNVTDPDKMREILDRNRQNLLQGIDDYLKIRNDIDIETDGRLDDDQISLLTQMKGKILDYEKRSAEMADDLIGNLGEVQTRQEVWQEAIKKDLEKAQEDYNNAKSHWEAVKNGKHNKDYKDKIEKKLLAAEQKLNKAKAAERSVSNGIKLLQMLTEEKDTTSRERAAEARGYGGGLLGRTGARLDTYKKRSVNSDEAQAILANPLNAITLIRLINNRTSDLDPQTKDRLTQEVVDLSGLANQKMAYNKKVREFMGDPSRINEAYQQAQDQISQKEKDNKSEELSLNIKNANSMAELDRIMREAYNIDSEIAKAALDKAKQTSDENTKKFIADYEQAVDFYGKVARQAQKLPQEVSAGVLGTAASEWENALQEGVDVYDKFIDGLNEAAEVLEKDGTPGSKETATGIRQVLSDLSVAKNSTATNKETKKSAGKKDKDVEEGESSEAEKKGFAALSERLKARREGKSVTPEAKPFVDRMNAATTHDENDKALSDGIKAGVPEKDLMPHYDRNRMRIVNAEKGSSDTKESLLKAVEQEVRNSKEKKGTYKIDSLSKLSKELRDRIQKYNEDNPGSEFMVDFEQLLQRLTDEAIADDGTNLGRDDVKDDDEEPTSDYIEGVESEKSKEMKRNQRVTFRSDYPSEFRIYDGDESGAFLDYRVPYVPTVEELKKWHPEMSERQVQSLKQKLEAIQKIMQEYKGYHFVDKNYLGYIAQDKDSAVPVYLLRSTEDNLNSDKANPVTFLAIKFDDAAEKSIRKHGYGGSNSVSFADEIRPVYIKGERYHIVGVMTLNGQVDPEVSQAFAELQGALNKELNPQIDEAKESGQPFVVSKFTTVVDTINTGRLEKRNDKEDDGDKVSLYDFVSSQQGDSTRSTSSEWSSGMSFYFGTIVNGLLNATEDDRIKDLIEEPNETWMNDHNGAIVMFVPKADGRLYPVRVTRRTVREWMDSTVDGSNTGRQTLNSILSGSTSNGYLSNIVNYLKTIYDEEAALGDKMNAKMMLQKYFIFGKQSPIHFNNGEVTLQFEDREHDITGDTFEDFANSFFDVLALENVKFTLPAESIESINGRDVIKSGIFEIGLRGFYNFNSNFTIRPINGEGVDISDQIPADEDEHFTGGASIRGTEMRLDIGDGMQTYIIQGDGTVTLNGEPVSTDKQNLVTLVRQAEQGTLPELISELLDTKYGKSPSVRKFVAGGITSFNGVYIIHADEDWVYDSRKANHDERLYKLGSPEGVALMKDIKQSIADFAQDNMDKIKELKKAERPEMMTPVTPVRSVIDRLFDIVAKADRRISDKDKERFRRADKEEIISKLEKIKGEDISQINNQIDKVFSDAGLAKFWNNRDAWEELGIRGNDITSAVIGTVKEIVEPVISTSTPAGGASAKMFAGKTLDDMNAKNGGLEEILAANKKNQIGKKVFEALQNAEEAGAPIDQAKIASSINAILAASREERKNMLNDLLNEINDCNK